MSKFRSAARTDIGRKREHNEDSFLANEELGLYIVCDGMGGHAGGETASRLAVQTVEELLLDARNSAQNPFSKKTASLTDSPLTEVLREAVEGACAAVYHAGLREPELQGMGTTCICLLAHEDHAIIGHVGDSRAYLVRDGTVTQLSEDHSLVNEQVRAGLLSEDEARHSRLRNIITRSVGFEEVVAVDLIGVETRPGDLFLLCSDGLSNLVEAAELAESLLAHPLEQVPGKLVQLANDRGGDDNITVIALQRVE